MKHWHDHSGKPPQEEMVGNWIGLVVVSIIFCNLFAEQWWSIIPRIFLLISAIEKTIKFIQNKEARESYVYKTTQEEMTHLWIATIIVSIIMNTLFDGVWFSQIPCAVLFIKSLETTYTFIKAQKTQKTHSNNDFQQNQYYEEENYTENYSEQEVFCQMCGRKKFNKNSRYCPACGAEYRIYL